MTRASCICCSALRVSSPRPAGCRSTSASPCDGEEETGGHSIVEFVEADERGADAAIIFDSGMIRKGLPAFSVATRGPHLLPRGAQRRCAGSAFRHVRWRRAQRGHALIHTLDQLTARDGRLAEPLREGIIPPTQQELDDWTQLPAGAGELGDQGARPADPKAAEEFYIRTTAEPALDVNGIDSGSPYAVKTVLPIRAAANVSVRLAPGQQPAVIAAAFERLIRGATPEGAELKIELQSQADAGVVSPRIARDPSRSGRIRTHRGRAAGPGPQRWHAPDRGRVCHQGRADDHLRASRCPTRTSTRPTRTCPRSTSRSGLRPQALFQELGKL